MKGDSSMRKRKMIAPIVITALIAVFLFLYLGLLFFVGVPVWVKIAVGAVLALDYGVSVFVLKNALKKLGAVKKMILVNTDYISGKNLEMLGLVKGSKIQSKNIGRDITQSFKTIVGGELKAYNEMMNDARALAT